MQRLLDARLHQGRSAFHALTGGVISIDIQLADRRFNTLRRAINALTETLTAEAAIQPEQIMEAVFVCNPVMHHLLLGIDPVELGQAPFALATSSSMTLGAKELDLAAINPRAQVYILPCIAGHVGADAAAVALSEEPGKSRDLVLVVDVGTNAEILLGDTSRVLACSSPTGPAFEGAQISSGQRAAPGAIEKLEAFAKVALETGLQHIVLLSGRGEHFASMGEEVIRNSGLGFTIVRSAWFAQNFSKGYLRDPILGGVLPMPAGDIAEPIIDIDDIADVVVAALTEDGHLGERYEVTGPRLMTFAEMADVLTATLGRPIQHLPITFEDFHANVAQAVGSGRSAWC